MLMYLFDFVVKPIVIFGSSLIFLRIAGKKAVSEMNSFDLLFVLVLGTVVSEPLVTKQLGRAMLYAFAIVAVYLLYSYASLNNKLKWLLIASPTVLIRNGDIDVKGLRKVRMTVGELLSQMRVQGYTKTADVELAMMEDMGKFSIIPKASARPVQTSDLDLQVQKTFIPIPVVMDGQIIEQNLKYLNKDRVWLANQLRSNGSSIERLGEITVAVVNEKGAVEVDTNSPLHVSDGPYSYRPGNENNGTDK